MGTVDPANIVTNSKRLNINVSRSEKLITKNMFLAIINLAKHIFTIHNRQVLVGVDIHAIFTS